MYHSIRSERGNAIIDQIKSLGLTGIVVASCSPHMHLKTFRAAAQKAGVNPYLVEMANIREHCSWVHSNKEEATAKAVELIRMAVEKLRYSRPLEPIKVPIKKGSRDRWRGRRNSSGARHCQRRHEVILVEKEPSIGGNGRASERSRPLTARSVF